MASTKFTDAMGREWNLALTAGSVCRVQMAHSVNLSGEFNGFNRLAADPVAFAGVLAAILKPQLETAGVTADDFFDSLNGDGLASAGDALIEAILAFMPENRRNVTRAGYERAKAIQDATCAKLQRLMEETADLDAALKAAAV